MNDLSILQGDAIIEMKKIDANSVDLIIADPPYNLGKDYGNNKDNKEFFEYLDFSEQWLSEAKRVLKNTGTMYIFMGVRFISHIFDILDRKLNMEFNSWICWHYTQGLGKTRGFSPRHDDVLMFTKSQDFIFNLDSIKVPQKYYRDRNNMRGANPGDVWQFSHVHYCNENRQNHPTQKPEGLMERMILASSNEGGLILDPFVGSGTTLRVCQQLNRKCIGIELNPEYIELIKNRLSIPFDGFDSIDPRMERVPLDLNDEEMRVKYLQNHKEWFLSHHENAIKEFDSIVDKMYGEKKSKNDKKQMALFQE